MKRNLTFIVLCKDATDLKEMGRALNNHPGTSVLVMSDDPEQVFTETARLRPTAVIINLVHLAEPGLKLVQRLCTELDRKSTRLNSSHGYNSYAVFCLKKKIP